jgi:UDP-N-acetylmuramoylalanine--D-glutamate ligase
MVAVTGTNGKGSVVSMVTDAFLRAGRRARAVGNIGDPIGSAVLEEDPGTLLVVEASSFQLYYCHTFAPIAAAIVNATADHLDWHPTVRHYRRAKGRIFRAQRPTDWAIVNQGDVGAAALGRTARAQVCRFRRGRPLPAGIGLEADWIAVAARGPGGPGRIFDVAAGGLNAPHQVDNAMAVLALVRAVDASVTDAAGDAIRGFAGLPHLHQTVATLNGVRFVDDSKATNPDAAAAAIRSHAAIVLIAGGRAKGLDLAPMVEAGVGRVRCVIGIGEAGPDMLAAFAQAGVVGEKAVDLDGAVRRAAAIATPGTTVLLAPGCASYDMFASQAERGDAFVASVRALPGGAVKSG